MQFNVILFAKKPAIGETKTRLVPPLTHAEASELARAFVNDLALRLLSQTDLEIGLALPPGASSRDFPDLERSGISFLDQGEGGLGERLSRVLARAVGVPVRSVALLGSDHPNLPLPFLRGALEVGASGDVGWIPTADGGFAAIAASRSCPGLFHDVPWSTPEVAAAIRRNASREGLRLVETGTWYDIDTGEDLQRLERELERGTCPETECILKTLDPPLGEREPTLPGPSRGTRAVRRIHT
jgi:hypothetical protein